MMENFPWNWVCEKCHVAHGVHPCLYVEKEIEEPPEIRPRRDIVEEILAEEEIGVTEDDYRNSIRRRNVKGR